MGQRRCLVLAALLLAGCQTISDEDLAARQDAECRSYGAVPGTDQYLACRMELRNRYEAELVRRREIWADGVYDASRSLAGG